MTSDVIARYHRIYSRNVWFLTGADEHGQKVEGNLQITFSVHCNHSEFVMSSQSPNIRQIENQFLYPDLISKMLPIGPFIEMY